MEKGFDALEWRMKGLTQSCRGSRLWLIQQPLFESEAMGLSCCEKVCSGGRRKHRGEKRRKWLTQGKQVGQ